MDTIVLKLSREQAETIFQALLTCVNDEDCDWRDEAKELAEAICQRANEAGWAW